MDLVDEEDRRRTQLLGAVSAAIFLLLSALVIARLIGSAELDVSLTLGVALSAGILVAVRARRRRLGEILMFGTALLLTASLVVYQGPGSARLGAVHAIVLILAFVGPAWSAIAYAVATVGLVLGMVAAIDGGAALPLQPFVESTVFVLLRQLAFATFVIYVFLRGYSRWYQRLAAREADLGAALAGLERVRDDLEARVRARSEELEQANADLSAFEYTVSHDLRAPLRHVRGYLDLFAARPGLAAGLSDEAARAQGAAAELSRRIEALLARQRAARTGVEP